MNLDCGLINNKAWTAYKEINYTINFKAARAQLQSSGAAAFLSHSKWAKTQFQALLPLGGLDGMPSVPQFAVPSGMAKEHSVGEDGLWKTR